MTMPQDCDPQVLDLLREANQLPQGRDQVAVLERALAVAQQLGGFDNEYWARTQLTEALYHVPTERSALTHYAWLRRALDTAGERLDEEDRAQVLWKLKWAMSHVLSTAAFDLATVRATIDDVERAIGQHGYRLRPVLEQRYHLAAALDDRAGMEAAARDFDREPRDRLSDCHACEVSFQAHLRRADPRAALVTLAPIVAGELTCAEQPALALAQAIGWHLDAGDEPSALAAYRRGWPLIKDHDKLVRSAAQVLHGLVRLGELDRAVDALLPRLRWLDGSDNDEHRQLFAAVGALVLDAASARGLVPETIDGRPVTVLRTGLREQAYAIAAAFDARNGTSVHRRQVDEVLATKVGLEPTLPPLRLGRPSTPDPGEQHGWPETAVAEPGTVLPGMVDPGQPVVAEPDAVEPDGVATARPASIAAHAAAVRARLDLLSDDIEQLVLAWREHRQAMLAELGEQHTPWAEVSFLDRVSATGTEPEIAEPLTRSALAAARRAGDRVAQRRAEAEFIALQLQRQGAADDDTPTAPDAGVPAAAGAGADGTGHREAFEQLAAIARELQAEGEWVDAAATWRRAALAFRAVLEIDLAREAFEQALPAQRLAGPPLRVALVLVELGQLLPTTDPVLAERCATEAAELAGAAGHPVLVAMAADLRARLACAAGDFATAHELLSAAVPLAAGGAGEVPLRLLHADVCIDQQDWVGLERQGRAICGLAAAQRDPALLALGQRHLGLALVETGRPVEAAELLEAAIARVRLDEPALVGPIGWALGNALSGSGESGAARTAYASAATAFEAAERGDEAAHAQCRAGDCAWDVGDLPAAAAHYDAAVLHARAAGSVEVLAMAWRSLASLKVIDGEPEAGLADLDAVPLQVRDFAISQGRDDAEEWARQLGFGVARQGARLLAGQDQPLAAAQRLAAVEPLASGEGVALVRAERGSYLAQAGDFGAAERLLLEALPQLQAEHLSGLRAECVGRWAQALHDAGHVQRAEQVWESFGG